MVEVEKDSDTGEEIVYFWRRGKPYLYLRNSITKRFIRRLYSVEKRFFVVVDYSRERAKKGNPLYIDSGIYTQIKAEEWEKREEIDRKIERALDEVIKVMFGEAVVNKLLETAGVEYGSKPYYTTKAEENKATALVVWKHHPEDKPRKKEEEVSF